MSSDMEIGPVQLLVVGFEEGKFEGKVLAELKRLREADLVRVLDLVLVHHDEDGNVEKVEVSDLSEEETARMGALAGALIGLGADGEEGAEIGALAGAESAEESGLLGQESWYVADHIPPGTSAGIALLEHRWAIPLRDAIQGAGGVTLADAWVHPEDLVAIGIAAHLAALEGAG
jgi:uncharacterized membrane protein